MKRQAEILGLAWQIVVGVVEGLGGQRHGGRPNGDKGSYGRHRDYDTFMDRLRRHSTDQVTLNADGVLFNPQETVTQTWTYRFQRA